MSYIPVKIRSDTPRIFVFQFMQKNKTCAESLPRRLSRFILCLLAFDRADGASFFASAAIDANIGIDLVLRIALGNRVYGAGIRASAAGNAIFRNFVRHDLLPPNRLYGTSRSHYYIIPRKNSKGFLRRFSDFFENFLGGMFQRATVSRAVLSKRDRRARLSLPFPACRPFRPC